ncbi:alpha/beta hydrolase-fold protein [Methylobacterium sp. Leaf88]|uniref:alpha/beta hydrolase n=1 Tax=Methylobacterium sp. Leaf88 TaxID=1736244 RepID=UPI0009EAC8A2|nr:alpha/beta hydrolase-fold protein [Methylobacterium sp. Leaf88]
MKALPSRRRLAALPAAAWLLLKPSLAHATADEPARLTGAVAFDLGGNGQQVPWRITLYVPPGEVPADGWPVLYLLDGNAVTATAIDIERVQAPYPDATGIATRFVVVGIGYPGDDPYDGLRRSWDYTPPPGRSYPPAQLGGPPIRTGGADAFLRFVLDDLRPAIARRCRVDPSRQAVFGHSFGGLFVLHALARAPAAFSHWIAASPSIYWEDAVVLESIAELEKASPNGARVLLLAGAYEEALAPFQRVAPDHEARRARLASTRTVELTRAMTERLSRISGVTSTFSLIPGRTHMTVLPEALNEAVAFFMQRSG